MGGTSQSKEIGPDADAGQLNALKRKEVSLILFFLWNHLICRKRDCNFLKTIGEKFSAKVESMQ